MTPLSREPFSHGLEGRAARSIRANWPQRTASGAAHRAPCFFSVDENGVPLEPSSKGQKDRDGPGAGQ
jgi:hypothetical protein